MRGRTRLAALVSGSSFVLNPILTLRKPDAQSEIAPQRLHPAWHSRCLHSSCASTSFPPRPAVFALLRGIGAVSLGHTPASVAILRSLACASPPIAIARAKNPASKRVQGTIFSHKNRGRPKCAHETESAFRFIGHTLAILPHIGGHCPAYSAILKAFFSDSLRRAVGGAVG